MAGSGHGSVTGLDDRTLGRIDLILFDADYPDAQTALEDSWRVAVFATDPRSARRSRARACGGRAGRERTARSHAARVPTSTALHRALLGAAFLFGIVAVALVATPRNSPITLHEGMLPAGLLAVLSVSLLWWLEPRRANGSLWGSRVPAVIHLIFGVLWLRGRGRRGGAAWDEVDPYHALPETSGLTLLACAGVAAIFLWVRALRADRSGQQTGIARITGDLWISRMRRRSSTSSTDGGGA